MPRQEERDKKKLTFKYIVADKFGIVRTTTTKRWWWRDKVEKEFIPSNVLLVISRGENGETSTVIGHRDAITEVERINKCIGIELNAKVDYTMSIEAENLNDEVWKPTNYTML